MPRLDEDDLLQILYLYGTFAWNVNLLQAGSFALEHVLDLAVVVDWDGERGKASQVEGLRIGRPAWTSLEAPS